MKKPALIISILFLFNFLQSQSFEEWSDPVALTDSLSFNSNPVVVIMSDGFGGDLFMFYEKRLIENTPKQIWMRQISNPLSEEQMIFGNEFTEYRNPHALKLFSTINSDYFLLFESNLNGNFDLFGVKFYDDGTFEEPFQLTCTPSDENSGFYSDYYFNYPFKVCWESDGYIIISEMEMVADTLQFILIDTIDSGNNFDPVCSEDFVAWRKNVNENSHIYYSSKFYPAIQWSEPDTVFATGNNINLSMANAMLGFCPETLCWENSDTIILYNIYSGEICTYNSQGLFPYSEPHAFNFDVITDPYFLCIITFCSGFDSNKEVYSSDGFNYLNPVNLSNNSIPDSYPKLYSGRGYSYYYELINIWQSFINGYIVLYKSDINISWGSVNENPLMKNNLNISAQPNPFSDNTKLIFYVPENSPVSINIYCLTGQIIEKFKINNAKKGRETINWVPQAKKNIEQGIYIVEIKQVDKRNTCKVIYSK
ncbi:MAG: T9SS type A sorting domain-containing protein [Bacteroidales bacterium]|nr:T9SS type A sorting domain-containing protein [Bacteroidales bacterium]